MIIWKGYGILVALAAFLGLVLAELTTRMLTHDDSYYSAHALPKLGGAVFAAVLAYAVAKALEQRNVPRTVIDKATGREYVTRRGDSFFFIPVRFLPYVVFALGVILAFLPAT